MMYDAAWRRDCSVSRFPSVIIFSATGRAALARVTVVVIRPCANKLVTRLRSVARRCHGLRPSFDPDFKCRIAYPVSVKCTAFALPSLAPLAGSFSRRGAVNSKLPDGYRPTLSSDGGGGAVW